MNIGIRGNIIKKELYRQKSIKQFMIYIIIYQVSHLAYLLNTKYIPIITPSDIIKTHKHINNKF